MTDVRILTPDDAQPFFELRLRALREHPEAFGSAPEDWLQKPIEQVRSQLDNLPNDPHFGAFMDGELVGIARWTRYARVKTQHRSFVTSMYVAAPARGTGSGRALLTAIINYARAQSGVEDILLSVTSGNGAAHRLYTGLGFVTWGTEPRALKIDGRYYDLEQMILAFNDGQQG